MPEKGWDNKVNTYVGNSCSLERVVHSRKSTILVYDSLLSPTIMVLRRPRQEAEVGYMMMEDKTVR